MQQPEEGSQPISLGLPVVFTQTTRDPAEDKPGPGPRQSKGTDLGVGARLVCWLLTDGRVC